MSELANSIERFRPLYFYVIYEVENKTHGYIVDWKPAWQSQSDYEVVYKFEGKEATYWVGTNELSFVREDALQFAIAVHQNRVMRYNCDLRPCSR